MKVTPFKYFSKVDIVTRYINFFVQKLLKSKINLILFKRFWSWNGEKGRERTCWILSILFVVMDIQELYTACLIEAKRYTENVLCEKWIDYWEFDRFKEEVFEKHFVWKDNDSKSKFLIEKHFFGRASLWHGLRRKKSLEKHFFEEVMIKKCFLIYYILKHASF